MGRGLVPSLRVGEVRSHPTGGPGTEEPARGRRRGGRAEQRGAAQNNRNGAAKVSSRIKATGARHGRGGSGLALWEELTGGAALLVAVLVLLWLATRPLTGTDELVAELEQALARTGRRLAAEDTLAGVERRLRTSPAALQYVRALRLARFGARQEPPPAAGRRALRRHLALRSGPLGKLRALWALPPRRRRSLTGPGLRHGA